MLHSGISEKIIKAFFEVYNHFGYGFLEKVYEKALILELGNLGLKADSLFPIQISYRGIEIGEYFADILVEDKIILELKAVKKLGDIEEAQLLNYLSATKYEVGLLLNFGPKAEFRRKILTNDHKMKNE